MKNTTYFLIAFFTSFLLLFILLEFFFRFVFVAAELPFGSFDHTYNILKYEENASGYNTIGRFCGNKVFWNINNMGWNSDINYDTIERGNKIAIIGDSYVEAIQIDVDKNFSALMRPKLPQKSIYSFGISGAPLSQYLNMSRYITKKIHPNTIVFNIVHNDFLESLKEIKNEPSFLTFIKQDTIFEEAPINANSPANFPHGFY